MEKKNTSVNIMTLMAMKMIHLLYETLMRKTTYWEHMSCKTQMFFILFTWTCPLIRKNTVLTFWLMNNFYKIGKFINTKFSNNEDTLHVLGAILLDAKTKSRPGPFLLEHSSLRTRETQLSQIFYNLFPSLFTHIFIKKVFFNHFYLLGIYQGSINKYIDMVPGHKDPRERDVSQWKDCLSVVPKLENLEHKDIGKRCHVLIFYRLIIMP